MEQVGTSQKRSSQEQDDASTSNKRKKKIQREYSYFVLNKELLDTAAKLKLSLDKTSEYQLRVDDFNGISPSSRKSYDKPLKLFWRFLDMTSRFEEMFMLLRVVPVECPSIRVSTVIDFLKWNFDYIFLEDDSDDEDLSESENDKQKSTYLRRYKEPNKDTFITDRYTGDPVPLRTKWSRFGSETCLQMFESSIQQIFTLNRYELKDKYIYAKNGSVTAISEDKDTWSYGNPLKTVEYLNFTALIKLKLRDRYVSQAKDAVTPAEQWRFMSNYYILVLIVLSILNSPFLYGSGYLQG